MGSNGSFQQTHNCLCTLVLAAQNHDLADVYQKTLRGIGQFQQWTKDFCDDLAEDGYDKLDVLRKSDPRGKSDKPKRRLLALPPFPELKPKKESPRMMIA